MTMGGYKELCTDMLADAPGEVAVSGIIHGDDNGSVQCTTKKCGHPFGAILSPKHDPVALAHATFLQQAGKTVRHSENIFVSKGLSPVAAKLAISTFFAVCCKIHEEEVRDRSILRCSVGLHANPV